MLLGRFKAEMAAVPNTPNNYAISLTISGVSDNDAAPYKAIAKNDHGESSAAFNIQKTDKKASINLIPNFVAQPKIKQTPSGVTFECVFVSDDPNVEVVWHHNGAKCEPGVGANPKYNTTIHPIAGQPNRFTATLTVQNVGLADGGEYKCYAKNKHGEGLANINLNIDSNFSTCLYISFLSLILSIALESEGQPPSFVEKPVIRYENRDIIIVAIIKATPNPEVQWQKSSPKTPIKTSTKYTISKQTLKDSIYKVQLVVKDFSVDDSGTYSAIIRNPLGEAVGNADVEFSKLNL